MKRRFGDLPGLPFQYTSSRRSHVRDENGRYRCPNCTRTYKYQTGLCSHLRYECGKTPQFSCPYCPHRAYHKGQLGIHIQGRHRDILAMMQISSNNTHSQSEMKIPPFLNQLSSYGQQKAEPKQFTNQLPQLDSKLLQNVLDVQAVAMQLQQHAVGELLQSVVETQPLPVVVQTSDINQVRRDNFSGTDNGSSNMQSSSSEARNQSSSEQAATKQSALDLNPIQGLDLPRTLSETWNHYI